jgi:hypothetical protein
MNAPLPAEVQLGGIVWSWIIPIALYVLTFVATWLLYRHFAGQGQKRD